MAGIDYGTSRLSSLGVGASIKVFWAWSCIPYTVLFSLTLLITRMENLCLESSYC